MRHIKFILLDNLCERWENGKLSGIDFLKLVIDLVLTNASDENLRKIKY